MIYANTVTSFFIYNYIFHLNILYPFTNILNLKCTMGQAIKTITLSNLFICHPVFLNRVKFIPPFRDSQHEHITIFFLSLHLHNYKYEWDHFMLVYKSFLIFFCSFIDYFCMIASYFLFSQFSTDEHWSCFQSFFLHIITATDYLSSIYLIYSWV